MIPKTRNTPKMKSPRPHFVNLAPNVMSGSLLARGIYRRGRSRGIGLKSNFHVRFGSKADICGAQRHVRFTPDSDRKSGLPHKAITALPPKADMCSARGYVRFGPKADIQQD